jgi:hypothetical protein
MLHHQYIYINTCGTKIPRVFTVDKNPAYPVAIENLKKNDNYLSERWSDRQSISITSLNRTIDSFVKAKGAVAAAPSSFV